MGLSSNLQITSHSFETLWGNFKMLFDVEVSLVWFPSHSYLEHIIFRDRATMPLCYIILPAASLLYSYTSIQVFQLPSYQTKNTSTMYFSTLVAILALAAHLNTPQPILPQEKAIQKFTSPQQKTQRTRKDYETSKCQDTDGQPRCYSTY